MKLRFRVIAPVAAACAVLLAGCGAARPTKYYSLDPPAITPAAQRLDVSLLIGRISAPLIYRDTRIVYRTGVNEVGLYEEHRWVEAPAIMVEEMLLRGLRQSGRYASVQLIASNAHGDYVLRGRVERFEEVEGKPMAARVWLHLSLYDPKDGHTVWTQNYEQDEEVTGSDLSSVVAGLNHNLQRGIQELTAGLDQYLAAHPHAATSGN
jgi:ABC-type uncharacterized transport system auxiliary subunit